MNSSTTCRNYFHFQPKIRRFLLFPFEILIFPDMFIISIIRKISWAYQKPSVSCLALNFPSSSFLRVFLVFFFSKFCVSENWYWLDLSKNAVSGDEATVECADVGEGSGRQGTGRQRPSSQGNRQNWSVKLHKCIKTVNEFERTRAHPCKEVEIDSRVNCA